MSLVDTSKSIEGTTVRLKSPKKIITVFASGPGLHHNFLRFSLDYLSKQTPPITSFPFTDSGTSHNNKNIEFSKKFNAINWDEVVDQNINNCIGIEANDLLYYQRCGLARAGAKEKAIDLHNLENFNSWHCWNADYVKKIYDVYNINQQDRLPKFIIRDSIKKGFLDIENNSLYKNNQNIIQQIKKLSDSYIIPVTSFFSLNSYQTELTKISKQFDLDLDLKLLPELYNMFHKKNNILQSHSIVFKILESIEKTVELDIPKLDVFQEGFIYAELEKNNDFIIMPLTDNFFTNTSEIIQYLKYYPDHYKAMNPNLPTFNNIPNPFFLYRQKTK